jgi:predicted nucleic acid-binding protein
MPDKVVDASAVAALLFGEPQANRVADRLKDASLYAPALLPFEVANVCLRKIRGHPADRDALIAAFALLDAMGIVTVAVEHAGVLALADATGLTAYDASYLWIADALGADLVTLDRQLERAFAASRRS